jgi:hypothetical protein
MGHADERDRPETGPADGPCDDRPVTERAEGELEVARVLLLFQGAILIATTIEAAIWGTAFRAGLAPVLFSGAAAIAVLGARTRLRAGARRPRRVLLVVEGLILATLVIDTVLAIVVRGALPPPVAMLTRLLLPLAMVVLLRRSARAVTPAITAGWGA